MPLASGNLGADFLGVKMERIYDHSFVPQEDDQLSDRCAHEDCGRSELEHEWTIEAHEANPGSVERHT